jgi:H+-transporting ATPase
MLFLEVSLTENWLIFVTRGSNTWPSWQLVGAIFLVDVLSTLFCVFGWLVGPGGYGLEQSSPPTHNDLFSTNGDTDIVTVVVIWGYSIGVTIVIAIVYFILEKNSWLNNLGRKQRNRADTKMENIIGHLSKLALQHERDDAGVNRWHIAPRAAEAEDDD